MLALLDYVWLELDYHYIFEHFLDYIRLCFVSTFVRTTLTLLDRIVGTYFVYNLDLDNVVIFDLDFMLFIINLDLDYVKCCFDLNFMLLSLAGNVKNLEIKKYSF